MSIKTLKTATQRINCSSIFVQRWCCGWPPWSASPPSSGFITVSSFILSLFPGLHVSGLWSPFHSNLKNPYFKIWFFVTFFWWFCVTAKRTHTFISAVKAKAKYCLENLVEGETIKCIFRWNIFRWNGIGLCAVQVYPCSIFHHLAWTTELCIGIFILLVLEVHLL